jgi:hypothetical protein
MNGTCHYRLTESSRLAVYMTLPESATQIAVNVVRVGRGRFGRRCGCGRRRQTANSTANFLATFYPWKNAKGQASTSSSAALAFQMSASSSALGIFLFGCNANSVVQPKLVNYTRRSV